MIRLDSIKQRLFFSYGILVLNIAIVTLLALYFLRASNQANRLGERVDKQRLAILNLISTDLDFLRFETSDVEFFKTGNSTSLTRRESLLNQIQLEHQALTTDPSIVAFIGEFDLRSIEHQLRDYDVTFRLLHDRIALRGFKDYGVEGKMREYAHQLEENNLLRLSDVLTLRRHEKDFLLRRENQYIVKFNDLSDRLIAELHHDNRLTSSYVLSEYQRQFNHLTYLMHEIGLTPKAGLLGRLNDETEWLQTKLSTLDNQIIERRDELLVQGAWMFALISVSLIIISCVVTWVTATRLSNPIRKLSQTMGRFMVSEGLNEKDVVEDLSGNELTSLSDSFIRMSRKLKSQFGEIVKQNNELKSLNDELDRFIYSAAHDLKSPLSSLDGLIQLADREIASEQHRHYFVKMKSSVRKLNSFISDITDYAKNKRQTLTVEKIDLERLIREAIDNLMFLPHAHLIKVAVNVSGDEFYSDKTRLEIILKNLISNSFRYVDFTKDSWRVTIEAVVHEQHLKLSIEDNGIGIEKYHLTKIFQMFYRAVAHSQGTGIGLFLVKESVKMLRGKIVVKSKIGEWTGFYLKLHNFKQGPVGLPEPEEVVYVDTADITI